MFTQEMSGSDDPDLLPSPSPPPMADIITAPPSVGVGDCSIEIKELTSRNGLFRFVMEPDRTIALYMDEDMVWAIYLQAMAEPNPSQTDGTIRLLLQNDGNLAAVDSSLGYVWDTKTSNKAPGPYTLTMRDNGNCTLCAGGGTPLWATDTARWG